MEEVEIIEEEDINLEGATVIDGFPSIGLVSTIAANYIIDGLHLKRIGSISSKYFPVASIVKNSIPSHPMRIYGREDLVVFLSEFKVPDPMVKPLAERLFEWTEEKGCKIIISGEGIQLLGNNEEREIKTFGIGTTRKTNDLLIKCKIEPFTDGLITGVSAMLLNEGYRLKRDVICILAEAHPNFPDARAAAKLVEAIDAVVPEFEIDTKPLYRQAEEIESRIKRALDQMQFYLRKRKEEEIPPYMFR